MTQILAYHGPEGILLASDSRAVAFDGESGRRLLQVQKLFHLSPDVVALTAGAGSGVLLCQSLQQLVRRSGLFGFEAIAQAALAHCGAQLEGLDRGGLVDGHDLDRLYILLAGREPDEGDDAFRLTLLASENRTDPLHEVAVPHILSIPRQILVEHRANQIPVSENRLDAVEALFERCLVNLADADDEVGPPFFFVRITTEGLSVRQRGE